VVLCNAPPANPGKVAGDLAAIMLGEKYELPKIREVADVDPKIFDAYEGQYQLRPDLILTIKRIEDKLTAQGTGQPKTTILPESETTFFNETIDAQITFVQDESGDIEALILKQNGQEIRAERIDSPKHE
jgi:hypothetical protein